MSTYTIGETSSRSGFSASALRFYRTSGWSTRPAGPVAGTASTTTTRWHRLAFITQAKQLGCSLEEITDLVEIWDGQRCGPVQRRFHELITARSTTPISRSRADGVRRAAAGIGRATRRRTDRRTVRTGVRLPHRRHLRTPVVETATVTFGRKPATVPIEIPIACTLEPGAMPDRLAEWASVLDHATRRTAIDGGLRIELGPDVDLGDLGRLIGAEQHCCAFFRFSLTVDADGIVIEVRAPELAAGMVTDLFGSAA